ncbi:MAG: cysteine--tRNA ligase [Campylobacter gracilis]|uniref:cysteine--tRNA ligase n=1 Tax=Campylobacter gracilis TaxID=824 RepID=UPI0026EFC559|nr:cysteine--tRNA ligase [Campylobacter gracilis]MBS6152125.1 cysteine--tRNA ligase [Campylobacter gracilis]
MVIYDSLSKKKLPFEPINEGLARIYACGPTVYDDAHLGHAKSAVSFDLLRRVLQAEGYEVKFARNFTDIDDKILKKMEQSGKSLEEITEFYTRRYLQDMSALNVADASISPKATENIAAICELISSLLQKGFAYEIAGDGIYFDTRKDWDYLSLSGKKEGAGKNIARVASNDAKHDEKDFVLWKFDENWFDSPFGKGRPGWHSECVAMILAHLDSGDAKFCIDIHAGGADLLFPHHENEAAQCRCARHRALSKYWLHNGFVQVNNEKMSKSLGNSFFVGDALKIAPGEALRFYLLSSHYRANFNYSVTDLLASKKRLDKIYRLKKRVRDVLAPAAGQNSASELPAAEVKFRSEMMEFLSDDLNTSGALAVLDSFVASANEALDRAPKDKALKARIAANLEFAKQTLGILYEDETEYFRFGVSEQQRAQIEELIKQRAQAKAEKDFAGADAIRARLTDMKIEVMDTPGGTVWEVAAE